MSSNARTLTLSLLVGFVLAVVIIAGAKLISVTNAIQSQRHALCVDQDNRHDKTVAELNAITMKAEAGQSRTRVAQVEAGKAQTLLLINALAPSQDCSRVGN